MKWYQFAIFNHDFLLAAMILSLDVMDMRQGPGSEMQAYGFSESEKITAILGSRDVWAGIIDECRDAPRAVKIIDAVLKKMQDQKLPNNSMDVQSLNTSTTTTTTGHNQWSPSTFAQPPVRHSLGAYAMPPSNIINYNLEKPDNFFDVMGSDLSLPEYFNWVSLYVLRFCS
jgi:hypothetical protein